MSAQQCIEHTRLFQYPYNVLDATLRDAGYMNDWAFSREEIFTVVGGVAKTGVEAIEVGYISDKPNRPLAACCSAELLHELHEHIGGSSNLATMISLTEKEPASLFASRHQVLDLVRIPSTSEEVSIALNVAEAAKRHEIACSFNLVNISTLTDAQLINIVNEVKQAAVVDIFYLADSRGACRPEEVTHIVSVVREHWDGILGFHAHNNTGFATVNPLMALDAGCQVIDGTVNGLGLGSGNTNLAHALSLVQQRVNKPYDHDPLDALRHAIYVPMPAANSYLYYLVGAKNFAQLWVEPLVKRYGKDTAAYLQRIPRKPYTQIEQIIQEIEA